MALDRRRKALQLMERVSRHEMEIVGTELSALRAEQSQLRTMSLELEERARWEADTSTEETRRYLPAFLGSVDAQRRLWAQEQEQLETQAAKLETQIIDAFRQVRTKELIRSKVERAMRLEEERSGNADLDDATRALRHAQKSG